MKTKKHTPEFRLEVLKTAGKIGQQKAALVYGLSRRTIIRWKNRYESGGFKNLCNKSKKEQFHPKKMPEKTVGEIDLYLKSNSKVTASQIKKNLHLNYSLKTILKKVKSIQMKKVSDDSKQNNQKLLFYCFKISKFKFNVKENFYLYTSFNLDQKQAYFCLASEKSSFLMSIFMDYFLEHYFADQIEGKIYAEYSKVIFFNTEKSKTLLKKVSRKWKSLEVKEFSDLTQRKNIFEKITFFLSRQIHIPRGRSSLLSYFYELQQNYLFRGKLSFCNFIPVWLEDFIDLVE